MALLNLIYNTLSRTAGGFFGVLSSLGTDVLDRWASKLGIGSIVLYLVSMALALIVGLTAYKYIKLYLPLGLGALGFFMGRHMFFQIALLDKLPDWCAYIMGALAAILVILLSFRRVTYAWFGGMTLLGYCFFRFCIIDDFWSAILPAVLLAFVTLYSIRVSFVLISSAGCSAVFTGLLFLLLPNVQLAGIQLFALEAKNILFWLAWLLFALVFVVVQLLICSLTKKARDED